MKSLIRYGILGTGHIASRMAVYIRESANSDVYAVASTSREKATAFAGKYNVQQAYGDYAALIDDKDVAAVYIALPNSLHFEYCKKALEHGKHVLCEKPFVLESRQLAVLEALAVKNNLKLMECFWYRFHPLIDMVINCVNHDLGAPLGFYSTFSFQNAAENDIRWNPALGGGALYDLMCYHIDALNYIFKPEFSQLSYLEAFSRQRNGVDANINIEALFSDKFQVILSSSIDRPSINRTTIVGTEASIIVPDLRVFPELNEACFYLVKNGKKQKIDAGMANPYARMVETFSKSIINNSPSPINIIESKNNMVLIDAVKKSLQTEMADRVALYPKVKGKFKSLLSSLKRRRK